MIPWGNYDDVINPFEHHHQIEDSCTTYVSAYQENEKKSTTAMVVLYFSTGLVF
jgi:hypothetical protein